MNDYDDIINLPHHRSERHPPMAREMRAAQFAPFAALTGYNAAVKEAARLTEAPASLDEEQIGYLNRKLACLCDHLGDDPAPTVQITYFVPDDRKAGGAFRTVTGIVRRMDECARMIELTDRTRIPMEAMIALEGDLFDELDFE